MGCASSVSAEQQRSKEVEQQLQRDQLNEKRKIKLLLLGAGESGKSTLFKQMKILYGKGFSEEDRRALKSVVHNNIVVSMKVLCDAADAWEVDVDDEEAKQAVQAAEDEATIDANLADAMQRLWTDDGIKQIFEYRSYLQLYDSAEYYFNDMDRICAPDYVPTTLDVLKSRVRTSGIVEEEYLIDDVEYVMYDVGGQRNERKKWIHCFDNVTAVIFVASMSEYDQMLYEDNSVNRLEEAINLFDEICNSRWFRTTSIILFLNKRDLFERKIKEVDIRDEGDDERAPRFLDYTAGTCTCDGGYPADTECTCGVQAAAKAYITEQFKMRNTDDSRVIYDHVVCATDTENVRKVFSDTLEIILRDNLLGSGFMS